MDITTEASAAEEGTGAIDVNDSLGRIYQQHRRGLFLVALAITRSSADAEDAVHEAFARLCRTPLPSGNGTTAYVFTAVRNASLDRLRRRRPEQSEGMSLVACLETADGAAAANERDKAIAAVIDQLPDDLRTVVFLRIFSGLTFRQIGEMIDVPLQTVVSRYDAALERLRPQLRKWK